VQLSPLRAFSLPPAKTCSALTWVSKSWADESRRFQEYFVLGKSPQARVDSLSLPGQESPKTLTKSRWILSISSLFLSPSSLLPNLQLPDRLPSLGQPPEISSLCLDAPSPLVASPISWPESVCTPQIVLYRSPPDVLDVRLERGTQISPTRLGTSDLRLPIQQGMKSYADQRIVRRKSNR
jgi:hypothetical protein